MLIFQAEKAWEFGITNYTLFIFFCAISRSC